MLGVAEVMIIEYNGRKKTASLTRLPMRLLYEKPKQNKEPDTMSLFSSVDPAYDSESTEEASPPYPEDGEDPE